MKIPIYNCQIEDSVNNVTGIYAISFVDLPANEVDFVALNKDTPVFMNKDSKKQVLTGVVLKPEQLIYRLSEQIGEHYIKFSAEQIEKIAHKMMKTGIALHHTTHQHQSPLSGNYLTELWIVENPQNDKSNALGFKNLPKGTLMCSYKIEDKSYWDNEVMTGNVKGFSLEGFFNQEISLSKLSNKNNLNMNKKRFVFTKWQRRVLSAVIPEKMLLDIEGIEKNDTTDSGEVYEIFTLADGKEVFVDSDGFATLDGEQMPAGEHLLADGSLLVIDENGNFVETKEASATNTDPNEATAAQTLRIIKHKEAKAKRQKLEEVTVNSEDVQALKDRIAELERNLAEALSALETAKGEAADAKSDAEQLRKKTPTTNPVVQPVNKVDMSKMTTAERISYAAQLAIQNKKK